MTPARRDAVLVLGADTAGPTTLAGILRILGMHAPTLESAPEGPSPGWVAELHERLLARANVVVDDARPEAWFDTGRLSTQDQHRAKAEEWLGRVLAGDVDELVLEDPALPWFLELWTGAASRLDVDVAYVLVLTPPTLAPGPGDGPTALGRAVSWLNLVLHLERATRGARRVAIRQADLLEDWTVPVYALGERWGLHSVVEAKSHGLRTVHDFVDSAPRVAPPTDEELPELVHTLVQSTSAALDRLAEGKDDELLHRELDDLRVAFIDLYELAGEIAGSSIRAGERRLRRAKERSDKEQRELVRGAGQETSGAESTGRRIVRKAASAWRRLRS